MVPWTKEMIGVANVQMVAKTPTLRGEIRRKRKLFIRGKREKRKSAKKNELNCRDLHDPTSTARQDVFRNNDLLSIIMDYLDAKTILFSMLLVSKAVEQQLTYEHAVRCTMTNSRGVRRMMSLRDLLQQGCIYAPSKLRILRLSIGKRCERCNCTKTNNLNNLGLFFCRSCTEAITTEVKLHLAKKRHSKLILRALDDERFAKIVRHSSVSNRAGSAKKVVRNIVKSGQIPVHDSGNEKAGPLLSFSKLLWARSESFDEVYEEAITSDPRRTKIPSILRACKKFSPKYDHHGIVSHMQPLEGWNKSLNWMISVLWENGEHTWESLVDFAEDDLESCLLYARKRNLLHRDGWKELQKQL